MLISNQLTVAVLHPQMFHDLSQYTLCVVDNDVITMYKNYRFGTKYMYILLSNAKNVKYLIQLL